MPKDLKVGDRIPAFEAKNHDGVIERTDDLLTDGPLVIYFYPMDDTPGCTAESCAFRDNFEVFTDAGARVVGVSADSPERHRAFREKHRLPFTLLSDKSGKLARRFGVKKKLGLLPGRVTFVFDAEGVLRHKFSSQFRATKHVDEALSVVRSLSD